MGDPILTQVNKSKTKKGKISLLPGMKELLKTNRMSHFSPFYDDIFL